MWEVEIIGADKQTWEIEVDANSGEILAQELENDSD